MSVAPVLRNNHLDKVICQIRYVPMYTIDREIGIFQKKIATIYPDAESNSEPQIPFFPNAPQMMNYSFRDSGGRWTVNVTNSFISLTTNRYDTWDEFRQRISWLLETFAQCYDGLLFQRIGLRYVNAIRPSRLFENNSSVDIKNMLTPSAAGLMAVFNDVSDYRTNIVSKLDCCTVQSIVGTIRFNDDGEIGILVDNDIYKDYSGDSVMSDLDSLNKEAFPLLEKIIREDIIQRMV